VTTWVYVDETKRGRYLLVAVPLTDPGGTRRAVTALILPGQRRLHMVRERDSRRRLILSTFVTIGIEATIYDAGRTYPTDREARAACFQALVEDLAGGGDTRLVIEQDDSLVSLDNQWLIELTRATGQRDTLLYEHQRASSDSLLAVPDALAWAWAKGGDWRRRAGPLIAAVRAV
jgi:hypothetical protein